uniref:Aspartic peptidase DDI1-type domain-containing protein n=1 Tax=Nicotiana tabacum TaxID=4097 RepID=A0A1S4BBS9_TOBAC|nr:PREDICTED: uncharacterized protein LOC107806605 [Nicotiana tabacum]
MGQLSTLLSDRAPGTLPADTEKNPKETIKDVSLRSRKTLAAPKAKPRDEREINSTKIAEEQKIGESLPKENVSIKDVDKQKVNNTVEESKNMPLLLFPQKMKREKLDKCFGKFLEMLKQLYVNIPFTENKIPKKCGDPGSFTIPCSLGSENFDKALCDSGASINLMPLSMFKKLEGELGVIKYVSVSLQLADQTTIISEGIIEDILVRVDKFIFPVDFIVVDMEENKEVPLILGRPFLYTGRAILDIYEGQLMLRVGNKKMVFQMKRMMKYLCDEASAYACLKLDVVGELAEQHKMDKLVGDSLERCISQSSTTEDKDPEIKKEVKALELKVLPTHLKYVFLETNNFPVIIVADLRGEQEHMLVELLRKHKKVVPKKGGMTVVKNEDNELIPTRTVTGWRICIDYQRLNDATRKDHFPLPFID